MATISSDWLVSTASQATSPYSSVSRGVIPPTIHHQETDPDCDLDVVANDAREVSVKCGVSTSLAFGGNDSALVIAGL